MVDKREYLASELLLRILKRNNIRHIVVLEKTDVTSELKSLILLVQSKPSESSAPTEEMGPLDYAFEVL